MAAWLIIVLTVVVYQCVMFACFVITKENFETTTLIGMGLIAYPVRQILWWLSPLWEWKDSFSRQHGVKHWQYILGMRVYSSASVWDETSLRYLKPPIYRVGYFGRGKTYLPAEE